MRVVLPGRVDLAAQSTGTLIGIFVLTNLLRGVDISFRNFGNVQPSNSFPSLSHDSKSNIFISAMTDNIGILIQ